jgi:hypothetical protein
MRRSAAATTRAAALAKFAQESLDLSEVPAAVVCANCGDALCSGCALTDDITRPSGVVAVIPWERQGLSLFERFWATSKLATLSCEAFFGSLSAGEIAAPLRFALLAELVAAAGLALTALLITICFAPGIALGLLEDPVLRHSVLVALGYAVPGLALAMVAIHTAHGVGLDLGARRQGSEQQRSAGARFGLYGCAWDLITLPLGLLSILLSEGPRACLRAAGLAVTAPRRAAYAYLRTTHRLDEERARKAARQGAGLALLVTLTGLAAATLAGVLATLR